MNTINYKNTAPLLLLLMAVIMTSCYTHSAKFAKNEISFDSIQIEKIYHLLESPDNPHCELQISFTYPTKGVNKEVLQRIQTDFIYSCFGDKYESYKLEEAVTQYTEDYIQNYKELEADFKVELEHQENLPIESWFTYLENLTNEIVYNKNGVLSYRVFFTNFTGGAHGSHTISNHVINLQTGEPITETDIFIENYQDILAQSLTEHIVQQNNLKDAKELESIGYYSLEEIFPNANFLIDDKGITYTFNEYEIAPYVVGLTEVFIPYEEIQMILLKNSPISRLWSN